MQEYKTVKNALPLTHFIMYYRDNKINRDLNRVGKQVTSTKAKKLFNEILKESAAQQNQFIKDNAHLDWLKIKGKDDSATRALFTYTFKRKLSHSSVDRWDRSDLQEAARLLKTWAQRNAIAELLDASGWTLSYDEVNGELDFTVDYEQYKNIKRSMSYPSLPWVTNPRILGGTLTTNVIKELKIFEDGILLEDFRLLDNSYDIFFPVSHELWSNYPNMVKIGYPTISKSKATNQLTFAFMISTSELTPKNSKSKVLGIDPGKTDIFTGIITDKNGVVGPVLGPSVETQRAIRKFKRIDQDIVNKSARLRNLKSFTVNNGKDTWESLVQNISKLESELASVRAKRARVVDYIDWNAAVDTVNHAKNNNALLSLEKVKFNTGEGQFRNGSYCFKVKHKASKNDVRVVDAPARNSSQKCHRCQVMGNRMGKMFTCTNGECGWSGDADVNGAANHSISGQLKVNNRKVIIGKGAPTPKRVKPPNRVKSVRTLPVIIEKRGAYYKGVSGVGKRVVTVVTFTPFKVKPKNWTFKHVNSSKPNSGTTTP